MLKFRRRAIGVSSEPQPIFGHAADMRASARHLAKHGRRVMRWGCRSSQQGQRQLALDSTVYIGFPRLVPVGRNVKHLPASSAAWSVSLSPPSHHAISRKPRISGLSHAWCRADVTVPSVFPLSPGVRNEHLVTAPCNKGRAAMGLFVPGWSVPQAHGRGCTKGANRAQAVLVKSPRRSADGHGGRRSVLRGD